MGRIQWNYRVLVDTGAAYGSAGAVTRLFHGRWKEEGLRPGAAAPHLSATPQACISLLPEASGGSLRAAPPHSAGLWEIWVLVLAGVCQAVPIAPEQVQILPPALTPKPRPRAIAHVRSGEGRKPQGPRLACSMLRQQGAGRAFLAPTGRPTQECAGPSGGLGTGPVRLARSRAGKALLPVSVFPRLLIPAGPWRTLAL